MLSIEVWLAELERVRLNFAYRIRNERGDQLIEGNTLHACTNTQDKLQRLPETLVAKLRLYVDVAMEQEAAS